MIWEGKNTRAEPQRTGHGRRAGSMERAPGDFAGKAGRFGLPRMAEEEKHVLAYTKEDIIERIRAGCRATGTRTYNAIGADPVYNVVFTPQGWRELQAVFHWGQEHPDNQWEQQARLLGHYSRDEKGVYTTVVCYVQPIYPAERSPASASIIGRDPLRTGIYTMLNENLKVIQQCDGTARRRPGYKELDPFWEQGKSVQVCGLAHTHPHMACIPSGTDRQNHGSPRGEPYITLIVNPQDREIYAMADYGMRPAKIHVLYADRQAEARDDAAVFTAPPVLRKLQKEKQEKAFESRPTWQWVINFIMLLLITLLLANVFLVLNSQSSGVVILMDNATSIPAETQAEDLPATAISIPPRASAAASISTAAGLPDASKGRT